MSPRYTFSYGVNHGPTNIDLGHSESRSNDDTKGKYYVNLPDGRQQIVKYAVDGDHGYVATVEYHGDLPDNTEYELETWPQYQSVKIKPDYPKYPSNDDKKYAPQKQHYYQPPKQISIPEAEKTYSDKLVYVKDVETGPASIATTQKPKMSDETESETHQPHQLEEGKGVMSAPLFREQVINMENHNEDKRW